ncbi:unnamed protein product [Albugo candida]|uniref:S-adenosyl-L-homocysteine hydrolase NAD binding domain-containing protein n=1 Tax=Albugo candida TaxID=65357 RepID=A0A024GT34_9STRA|nr:unnamed protein product [Albugo candida]|eukprot:CCI49505.1 unnamed protein product [Albugo candida]
MRIAVFSTREHDIQSLTQEAKHSQIEDEFIYLPERLKLSTAILAQNCDGVLLFVSDSANAPVLNKLNELGVRVIFLRCTGFDKVDLAEAKRLGLPVVRIPSYSPHAVAEHAVALLMTLNRHTHRAYNRTRESNFSLNGLLGFDVHTKTIGVIGTGKIGFLFARTLRCGFGARVLAYDVNENEQAAAIGVEYHSLDKLLRESDIISLHCPLTPETQHIIGQNAISKMKEGVIIINSSRGGLVETRALVDGLKSKKIGAAGLDVFEGEDEYFYGDHSNDFIKDDMLARLFTFPNVLITGHQAFFTKEALETIAKVTMENIKAFKEKKPLINQLV